MGTRYLEDRLFDIEGDTVDLDDDGHPYEDPEPGNEPSWRVKARIQQLNHGVHPVTGRPLLMVVDPSQESRDSKCRHCTNLTSKGTRRGRQIPKCGLVADDGRQVATDLRLSDPACSAFERRPVRVEI